MGMKGAANADKGRGMDFNSEGRKVSARKKVVGK
jgi:hypothetical protein